MSVTETQPLLLKLFAVGRHSGKCSGSVTQIITIARSLLNREGFWRAEARPGSLSCVRTFPTGVEVVSGSEWFHLW
jgi:hypothetical protein